MNVVHIDNVDWVKKLAAAISSAVEDTVLVVDSLAKVELAQRAIKRMAPDRGITVQIC